MQKKIKLDKVSQKTMFIIKTLGFSLKKNEPNYYKNVYYNRWKKTLSRFYDLNIKNKNNEINEKENVELQKIIQKLSNANIL